jgi:hypothetical protein
MTIRMTMALCAALLFACAPETDRDHYEVGESGLVHFENTTLATLYLGGCNHFDYEKQIGDEWVSQGPDVVCVWEGFAEAVLPGAVVADPIQARAPGTWRLRYPVGIDCAVATPLSTQHCRAVGDVTSNPFEVVESGCVVSGCSGQLCAEEPMASTCEWLPQYACYQSARCGRFGPEGSCAWGPTPELAACLEENGAPGLR